MNIQSLLKLKAGNTFYSVSGNIGCVEEYYVRAIEEFKFPGYSGVLVRCMLRKILLKGEPMSYHSSDHVNILFQEDSFRSITKSRNRAIRWAKEAWDRQEKPIIEVNGIKFYKLQGLDKVPILFPVEGYGALEAIAMAEWEDNQLKAQGENNVH